jgi:two-component system sensor histidine kinase YesM
MKITRRILNLESVIYISLTLIVFATIFLLQFVAFGFTVARVQNAVLENSRANAEQLAEQVDLYIAGIDHLSALLARDPLLTEVMAAPSPAAGDDRVELMRLRMQGYQESRNDISQILALAPDGSPMLSGDPEFLLNPATNIQRREWFRRSRTEPRDVHISSAYVHNLTEGNYDWVVSISRGVLSEEGLLGVLLVDLQFNHIRELCRSLVTGEKGYSFIIDRFGNYIYHPFQQLIYSDLKEEPVFRLVDLAYEEPGEYLRFEDRYYHVATSESSGWLMVSTVLQSDITSDWTYTRLVLSLAGLGLFLIIGLLSAMISRGITRPVTALQGVMKSVDSGVFNMVGEIRGPHEIRELAREYDVMVGRIRELMTLNEQEQELKRKSDLRALQAQINPHFLYNTLDSIIWMSEMGDNESAIKMTSALSKLFRIGISKGKEFILIRDELEHVESYLKIQKMRYREKFEYSIELDPDLFDESCLKNHPSTHRGERHISRDQRSRPERSYRNSRGARGGHDRPQREGQRPGHPRGTAGQAQSLAHIGQSRRSSRRGTGG